MPEFIMPGKTAPDFADLPGFAQGYIEAMFWTETAHGYSIADWHSEETQADVREGRSDGVIPEDAGFVELHPDSLANILTDCAAFEQEAGDLLAKAYDRDGYTPERAGHDYWLTRNGHGTGFWDRSELDADKLGDALSEVARGRGEPQVWFADHVEYGDAPYVYHD